jgi:enoyl-CoA hydratase
MLTTSIDGNVLRIQLDDGKANVLGSKMLAAIRGALEVGKDADAVLISGREKVFSGGLDLKEVAPLSGQAFFEFLDGFHATFRALFAFERPLVVCCKGSAVAGGAILLCTGDVRLGSRDAAMIGAVEVRLGVSFPSSALEVVRAALTQAAAPRALALGELFDKERALAAGFFHELHELAAIDAVANERAHDVAKASSRAVAATKRTLRKDALARMDADKDSSHRAFVEAWTGTDAQARLAAILAQMQKR